MTIEAQSLTAAEGRSNCILRQILPVQHLHLAYEPEAFADSAEKTANALGSISKESGRTEEIIISNDFRCADLPSPNQLAQETLRYQQFAEAAADRE